MKLLIKGGRLVDPRSDRPFPADVLIEGDRIVTVAPEIAVEGVNQVIDARDKLVFPGLIDMHVHLREPGFEAKETIASGGRAAAAGGFTSVACMPNTNPVADNKAVLEFINARAAVVSPVKVYPIASITKGSLGEELAEIGELKEAGAVALSDDGRPVMNSEVMRRAMEYAKMFDLPVISHAEDLNLRGEGVMHEGYYSTVLGLKGMSPLAEEVMVARDLILAERTGCRLHIAHVSTAGSVRLIREAKARGVPVTAEAAPHHFTLTDAAVMGFDPNTKVNPPLRSERDVAAIKEGLQDGTIDVIATDHAPHTLEEKEGEYQDAPFGISGLETALPLVMRELVDTGVLSLNEAIRKMTINPASILKIPGGSIQAGGLADVTIYDPEYRWQVTPQILKSQGKNTPFLGQMLCGKAIGVVVNGKYICQM